LLLASTAATAHAMQILERKSSWNEAHDFIYTDVTLRQDDGSIVTRRIPGGSVDGIGMMQFDTVIGAASSDPQLDYLRATSKKSGVQLRWDRSRIFITPDSAGTTHIAGDQEFNVIADVLTNWENSIASCSYMKFTLDPPEPGEAKYDGKNVIKFREQTWCRPASGMDPGKCYDSAAAAITTVFYVDTPGKPNDGLIRDADIEINAVNFDVAICSAPMVCQTEATQTRTLSDLANTLTHEVGHLLGLDHTCWDLDGTPPNDDQGQPIPLCGSELSAEVMDATMYNYQDSGEIKKRSLEPDDIEGICGTYPLANDPGCEKRALDSCNDAGACATTPVGGRNAGAARTAAGLASFFVMLLGGWRAWRRRRSALG
jgi:hypothetical protein